MSNDGNNRDQLTERDLEVRLVELLRRGVLDGSGSTVPALNDEQLLELATAYDAGSRPSAMPAAYRAHAEAVGAIEGAPGPNPARMRGLTERAEAIAKAAARAQADSAGPSLWRLAVEWVGEAVEVLRGVESQVAVPAVALRSRGSAEAPVRFAKKVERGEMTLELERLPEGRFHLWARYEEEGDAGAANTARRFSLFRGERELRSDVSLGGPVHFANLNPGTYLMRIASNGEDVGAVELEARTHRT